jgi:hypothetical protein
MAQNTPGASDDGAASDVAALLGALEKTTLNPNAAPWEHGYDDWAPAARATALPDVWALVAEHSDGLVAAWRMMRVCKAARVGAKEWLRTLPGFVVCGGHTSGSHVRDVWRLDLATLRWEPMPALLTARDEHACCAVRDTVVVLGGGTTGGGRRTSSVEMLPGEQGAFVNLPSLSCGGICLASAIAVDESDSAAGQVLLLGGSGRLNVTAGEHAMHLVDLATGTCTRQPDMLHARYDFAAARLKDGRVVCAGGRGPNSSSISAEVYGPPVQSALHTPRTWTELPAMSVGRRGCRGCVMSDGRLAVLGGGMSNGESTSSCEALVVGDDAHWGPLAPMHASRVHFTSAAVAGCVIVAGGWRRKSAEVYDEVLDRWFRLPRDLPHGLAWMGSALL